MVPPEEMVSIQKGPAGDGLNGDLLRRRGTGRVEGRKARAQEKPRLGRRGDAPRAFEDMLRGLRAASGAMAGKIPFAAGVHEEGHRRFERGLVTLGIFEMKVMRWREILR